jgi:hypothetical protein
MSSNTASFSNSSTSSPSIPRIISGHSSSSSSYQQQKKLYVNKIPQLG